jgi:hypothetical protein
MISVGFNKVFDKSNVALGNHLFQYVICRTIAERNGFNFFIPEQGYLNEVFSGIDFGIRDGDTVNTYVDSDSQFFNSEIFNISDFTHLTGFFQSEEYFQDREDRVKSWFRINKDEETEEILKEFDPEIFCYIHIRGGDNVGKSHNWLAPKDYYSESMERIKKDFGISNFCIVTDDSNLSASWFPEIPIVSRSLPVDFKLIYYSRFCIISNSTFSWWASWLSNKKIVIAPDYWLNYNQPELGFFPIGIKSKKFTYL